MKKLLFFILIISGVWFACKKVEVDTTAKLVTEEWLKNLDTPWQIVFAPDGRIFFTERAGRVRVVKDGVLSTWLDLTNIVETGESGLLGIGLDPNFATNGYVYIAYTYTTPDWKFNNRIVRCKENKATGKGAEDKIYIDNIRGQQNHNGGPIKFGPDGKMYWTVGDGFDDSKPQDLTSLNGKVLRLNLDGTVPSDNPFPNSFIWSYGNRNVQGMAWQEGTNNLFVTEHGPSTPNIDCCKDEINIIEKGKNYGWPTIRGTETKAGMESPIWLSGTDKTWAPAGAIFVKKGKWKGSFLFVGLKGETLYRAVIDPSNPRKILRIEEYMKQTYGRLRDIAEAPDGTFYICVSNKDGRGVPKAEDDRIIKLTVQ
jgi:glucose/arabinose dehydrogenase